MPDHAPQSLGGYRLIERIGQGGMGEVWRAERLAVGTVKRRAAIKRILPIYHSDGMLRERFLAEARITARLEHPNIVQLIEFGDSPELYLVLEYVEGTSLAELMRRAALGSKPFPVAAALFVIAEAATGLDYAHRRTDDGGQALSIVHRDVSPPNVMISVDGAVKVNDFGIARAADNLFRTQAGISVGKLVYMAPEQANGKLVDRRADVFALGVVLWELLTLRPLIPRDNPAAAMDLLSRCEFPPPSQFAPGIPANVDAIVREALAKNPDDRTSSAGRLAKSLRTALHALTPGYDSRELAHLVQQIVPELSGRSSSEPVTPPPASPQNPAPRGVLRAAATGRAAADAVVQPQQEPARGNPPPNAPLAATQNMAHPPFAAVQAQVPQHPAVARPQAAEVRTAAPQSVRHAFSPQIAVILLVMFVVSGIAAVWLTVSDDDALRGNASATNSSAAPSAATILPAARQAVTEALVRAARTCTDQAGLRGYQGTTQLDAVFLPNGAPASIAVRSVVTNGPADQQISDCIESAMRTTTLPATLEGLTIAGLSTGF